MKYVYPACFYQEEDGRYSVEIPDFQLATFGDDLPKAMEMAADAVSGRILLLLHDGESIPNASEIKDVKLDDESGFISLIYADLDTQEHLYDDTPIDKVISIPKWLNQAAERKNINFSAALKDALLERLAR